MLSAVIGELRARHGGSARFAVVACLAATLLFVGVEKARAQDVEIAGAFAIGHDVVWIGDQVVVTMTLELRNEGSGPAHQVVVTLAAADPGDGTNPAGDAILFSFQPLDITAGSKSRVKETVVLAGDQWRVWQRGDEPIFWMTCIDAHAASVAKRLLLAHVTSIADPDAAN
jgi:hypothetical protein